MTLAPNSIRQMLHGLPSLAGPLPSFDPGTAPADPTALFEEWLGHAIDAGVPEPHAMTLSTVDTRGRPAARTLILRTRATGSGSSRPAPPARKASNWPWAALTFYWPALGRQVRIGGADFMARSTSARATAWIGRQSEPLSNSDERELAIRQAAVQADEVEFWQGHTDRNHTRLRYIHNDGTWSRTLLWP